MERPQDPSEDDVLPTGNDDTQTDALVGDEPLPASEVLPELPDES